LLYCIPEQEILEKTVCIVQSSCVNVHSVTGKDFISPLPFQVSSSSLIGMLLHCLKCVLSSLDDLSFDVSWCSLRVEFGDVLLVMKCDLL
jgi:hypothetical protein